MAQNKPNKLAFLSMQAPPGYVAGLGRGASGFTTRSDIGPARQAPSSSSKKDKDDAGGGGGGDDDDDGRYQDPENETALFAGTAYDRDDEEADRIWEDVDRQMDERRRKFREQREQQELEQMRKERPKIQAQFADLKRGLSSVTEEEWAALPEASNITGKKRKAAAAREARETRSIAIPDSVLLGNAARNVVESTVTEDGMASQDGTLTSLTEIGSARNKIFSHQLDQASSSSSAAASGTASTVDPKGYLTELSSVAIKSNAEIGDIKKARSLLDSVIKTNPKHAPGWIAAARVEEVAGKMASARKIIAQGCDHCPKSEDVWLENARLNTKDNAKVILARAVQHLSQSVKIWLKAVELENDPESKKRVLRKSLEYIPNSVKLWKELVNLEENPEDARILLSGAVGAIPRSIELWLALARLSPPAEAQKVLNQARKTIPTSHEIWIAACRLIEETEAKETKVDNAMVAAVRALRKAGAVLSRDQWLREAEKVEKEGSPMTCAAIVKATMELDLDEQDRRTVWVEDAESAQEKGCIETARSLLAYTLKVFPDRSAIWRQAAELEKQHGSRQTLEALLERAVGHCAKAEDLWLMYAKEKWLASDVGGAREVLIRAFDKNIGSEEISLAAAKLESETGQKEAAAKLLERARIEVGTARVWLKSAVFERDQGRLEGALALVRQALEKFGTFDKLHMMHGQLLLAGAGRSTSTAATATAAAATGATSPAKEKERIRAAREAYSRGVKACPHSIPLWLLSSRLEEQAGLAIRARALLEKARLVNPKTDVLWHESVEVEERANSTLQAKTMLSRGLQECPASGLLWSKSIWMEAKPARKTRSADALKRTGDDARVICTVARLFWNDRKVEQARKWFERAVRADRKWGDGWAWWCKFERVYGSEEVRERVKKACEEADPKYGEVWQKVRKEGGERRGTEEVLEAVADRLVVVT
ncbi:U4/U6 x U5 tri-snRNP complex subunit Prp1 [Thecaphora frezii]